MPGHVFISYVSDDASTINRLARDLETNGVEVWLDRKNLEPGMRWKEAIRHAIAAGDLFVACFSRGFAKRSKTYMHEELTIAIEELRQRPADRRWFLPVLVDVPEPPDIRISAMETLRDLHWLSLELSWEVGVLAIVRAALGGNDAAATDRILLGRWVAETELEGVGRTVEDVVLERIHSGRIFGTMRNRDLEIDYDFTLVRVADRVWNYSFAPRRGIGPLDHGAGIIFFHSNYLAHAEGVAHGAFGVTSSSSVNVKVVLRKAEN